LQAPHILLRLFPATSEPFAKLQPAETCVFASTDHQSVAASTANSLQRAESEKAYERKSPARPIKAAPGTDAATLP
jgi:hypothetical protein